MWTSDGCSTRAVQVPEPLEENDNEYDPPRKKQKESSENEALMEAIECCKNQKLGVEEASAIYGVPKRTLRARLKNSNFSAIDERYRVFVFPIPLQVENELAEMLQTLVTSQVTLTSIEIRRLAYELISEKYNVNGLPKEKNCLLGHRWFENFSAKYPHLNTENHPALKIPSEKSANFFNALENYIFKYKIDSSRIFCVDGIELRFRASNVDDMKIFPSRKTIYTDAKAICCTSPTGNYIPPVFIKPYGYCNKKKSSKINTFSEFEEQDDVLNDDSNNMLKPHLGTVSDKLKELCKLNKKNLPSSEDLVTIQKQIKAHLSKKLQPMSEENEEELREKLYEQFRLLRNKIMSKYEITLNEVTHDIFFSWFQSFITQTKSNPRRKVLLLLSDQNYIKNFKTLEYAKSNGIVFLVLPPHSVHKIYPLDGFAMSLNRNLSTCARCWLGKNPDFKLRQVPLHLLFQQAYSETINPVIAKNGFLYSGIWPINRNVFDSTLLGGESLLLQKNSQLVVNGACMKAVAGTKSQNVFPLPEIKSVSDLGKLCRLCMKEKMCMRPLFQSLKLELNCHGQKISEITNMPVSADDGLPRSVCMYCVVQLKDTIKIRTMAQDSHEKQLKLKEALDRLYFENEDSADIDLLSLFQSDTSQQNHNNIVNHVLTKNFDINSLCRICMGEKPLMTSIFFKPQDGTTFCADYCKKVMEVSQCQVHIHDGLSSTICPFCRASINQAFEFIQRVLSSDKRFREIISQIRGIN